MVSLCRTLLPQTSADMAMDLTMAPRARGGPLRCAYRRRSPGQLTVQSVEDGKIAAHAIDRYLRGKNS